MNIRIIAPSGIPPGFTLENLKKIVSVIENYGFLVSYPENMIEVGKHPFCANSTEARLKFLTEAVLDKDIDIIWAIRGGYGASNLINGLDNNLKGKEITPKYLIGFSDITALHLYFNQNLKMPSLHANMIYSFLGDIDKNNLQPLTRIMNIITKEFPIVKYPVLCRSKAIKPAKIEGISMGGNLTLIDDSLACLWEINMEGRIVLIEDVNLKGYHLDRYLNHLWNGNKFQKARAVIFGAIEESNVDKEGIRDAVNLFIERADKENIPVFSLPIFGHIDDNHPIPLGVITHIDNDQIAFNL